MPRIQLAVATSAIMTVAIGCGGGETADQAAEQGAAQMAGCGPIEGTLAPLGDASGLSGQYTLRLVATSGEESGQRAEGTLRLRPHSRDMQQVMVAGAPDPNSAMPLYGTVEIDLDLIDAQTLGSLMSHDPMQPGVLVLARRSDPVSITLRFGSEANRRDVQRFDGGYTALRVQLIDGGNFFGTWASGVMSQESSGYFCAVRTGD